MTTKYPSSQRLLICGCSIAAFIAVIAPARAQFISKANNTDPLNAGTSWIGGTAPDGNTIAQWDSAVTAANTTPLGGDVAWRGIKVTNPTGLVTIDAGGVLTLGVGGIDMSTATQDLTINADVTIGNGRQIWNVAAGRKLTLAAPPTKPGNPEPNNAGVLQLSTTGTIVLGTNTTNLITDNANNPWATFGTNDWAGLNAGTVVASTYTDAATALTAGAVNDITGDFNVNVTVDVAAIRFNDPIARTINVSTSNNARTLTARGILVTANSGGGTIGGTAISSFIRPARTGIANTAFNIIQNSASDFTIAAIIPNASSNAPVQVVKSGPGKLILANNNAYNGGTTINEGTLQIGAGGTLGSLGGGDVTNNGALIFNRSDLLNVTNNINGTGSVTQTGPGELVFSTNISSYTGATIVNGGTLTFASLANLGSGTNLNINGGALKWATGSQEDISSRTVTIGAAGATLNTNGNNVTIANSIGNAGAGALTKAGTGTLTLSSANNYLGGTSVSAGTLLASNTTGSATGSGPVAVNSAGTLGGSGTIAGAVTVNSAGALAPGNTGVGTLTLGGLSLSAGSLLTFDFNATARDFVAVTAQNGLTLDGGAFSIFTEGGASGFGTPGSYNLFSYAGAIQGAGVGSLSVVNPVAGFNYAFAASNNFVTLTIAAAGLITNWTGTGGGSWGVGTNWSNTVPNQVGATANFGNTITAPATVTLDGDKTVGAITFDSAQSYTIARGTSGSLILQKTSGNGQGMVVAGAHTISAPVVLNSDLTADVATNGLLTVSGEVSGAKAVNKTGNGTLALTAANTYTGGTQVNGGTLTFASLASLGTGNLAISGGTLRWATGNTADISARTVAFGPAGATLNTNGNDVVLGASIGGTSTGGLTKTGAGTLTLSVDNQYTGATTVTGGTLAVNGNGALGDQVAATALTLDGGALRAATAFTLDNGGVNPRGVTIGAAGGTIDVPELSTLNVPGLVQGAGALTKTGPGALVLTNNGNAYNGTVVAGGNITLAADIPFGMGGLAPGSITFLGGTIDHAQGANNTLIYAASTPMTIAAGQTGTLTTPNRFRLNSPIIGEGTLNLNVNSTVSRADFQNNFAGFTGTLNINGSGSIRLGVNALAGGEPNFNFAGWADTTMVLDGATISVQTNSGGNTLSIGALSSTGTVGVLGGTINAGAVTWQIGAKNLNTTFQGAIADGVTATATVPTNLTKVGTGSLTLNNVSFYTGATTVNEGALIVSGGLNGTTSVTINGGELRLGVNDAINDLAVVTGVGGALATNGFSDTLGSLSVTGPFTIDLGVGASVLRLANSSGSVWFGALDIANWSGLLSGGGADQLFFGSDATGLTAEQLALIQFTNPAGLAPGTYGARILGSGEIVAVPEPASAALLVVGVTLLGMRRRRTH